MSDEEVQTKAPAKRGRKPKAETAAAKKEKVIMLYFVTFVCISYFIFTFYTYLNWNK